MPTKNQIKAYKEVMEGTWPDLGQRVLTNLGFARLKELSDGVAWYCEATGWVNNLDRVEFWLAEPEGYE